MKSPLLEFARVFIIAIAAASGALVLGAGNPAWGTAAVTEEQAEAAVVAAAAADADADGIGDAELEFDVQVVETVIWSEPQAPPDWFPPLGEDYDLTAMLSLSPSPVQSLKLVPGAGAAASPQSSVITNEPAVIPLPPAAWTGLAGLASLAIVHGRKAIIRFFT